MKTLTLMFALLLTGGCLQAAPILTVTPTDASVAPGGTVAFGFSLENADPLYLTITSSFLLSETEPIGIYEDVIATLGGPVDALILPGTTWNVTDRLGKYVVSRSATAGTIKDFRVLVLYEAYSDDPRTCGFCFVGSKSIQASLNVEVIAAQSVPEPASAVLVAAGLAFGWALRRRSV
ncbi:MAG TPA: PEP-CTERM sorting domain-containing protein [Bryobacteraceae bacterium]|nr:PEP-CTERM sorting domain-containing protein [Bryobacteraceae bacterium]